MNEVTAPADTTPETLLDWVYDGLHSTEPAQWHDFYADRACVAPTNDAADQLNNIMFAKLDSASEHISYSRDFAVSENPADMEYSSEFLHSLTTGRPQGRVDLRISFPRNFRTLV